MSALRLSAALACAALVLAAGCEARPPAEAQGRDVVRPALGFAVDVPPGWTFRELFGDVVLEMFPQAPAAPPAKAETPPAAPRAEARLRTVIHVVVIDREGVTLDAWADQAVKESQDLQGDLAVLSRTPTRLADGREALLVVLKNPRGAEPLVQRMLLAMTEKRACGVLATGPESDMASADAAIKKCFDSFVAW